MALTPIRLLLAGIIDAGILARIAGQCQLRGYIARNKLQ